MMAPYWIDAPPIGTRVAESEKTTKRPTSCSRMAGTGSRSTIACASASTRQPSARFSRR